MIMKSKFELERIVLEEMRSDPHCALLTEVRVETDRYGVWFIVPVEETSAFSPEINRAAGNAQINLRQKYRVAPEI